MVSLDHTIYFHHAKQFKADEWLLTEVKTDWADNGRGVVLQKYGPKMVCYLQAVLKR